MVIRLLVVVMLILGIIIWTGNADVLINIHMLIGIITVLCLWVFAVLFARAPGGNWGLAIGAIVLGIVVALVGSLQQQWLVGSAHWVIQVIHLLLGLSIIGIAEAMGGRVRRQTRGVEVQAR
ncbi:MAG TPA: hypothetical protein DHW02_19880 [Ktedonobacter sp.]|nr:hypothetical protein [Ktedonobacter sp.]